MPYKAVADLRAGEANARLDCERGCARMVGMIQDEFVAGKLIDCVVDVSTQLNAVLWLVKERCPEEEFLVCRERVGAVMGDLYDIVRPLAERHPKLSPPGYFPDLE